jgi:hypothetical protein
MKTIIMLVGLCLVGCSDDLDIGDMDEVGGSAAVGGESGTGGVGTGGTSCIAPKLTGVVAAPCNGSCPNSNEVCINSHGVSACVDARVACPAMPSDNIYGCPYSGCVDGVEQHGVCYVYYGTMLSIECTVE